MDDETLDVVTMEYDDLKWKLAKADSALYGTRLIITTTELNANAIPIINVRKLIGDKPDQLWKNYFSTIMSSDRLKQMVDEIVILFTIEGVASHLSFLNPNVIIEEVEDVVKFFEMTYNIHFESYLRINLFMHLAAMIERLMTHDGLNHREDSELTDQLRNFIALTPEAFRPIIAKYRFAMTTTEYLMIYELMEPWITVDQSLLVLKAQRDSVQVSGDA
ncbi:MAG: PRD domain-containing protein [Sodalis sp. (in: enterobacteria)]|uniref:PRD domain-containing protein n=1 Tax=Sodalis sp. (in: enterobacteria) TaxID=1898979 RepID=UPI0039E5010B